MIRSAQTAFITLMVLFMSLPIIVVGAVSFNERKTLLFPPRGFSLRWYGDLFSKRDWVEAVTNSLVIATFSGIIAISIALPISYYFWRHRIFFAKALFTIGLVPFMLPPVVTALGFLIFWVTLGHYGKLENDIISHGVFLVTLPLMMISLGLETLDRSLVEAAGTMGANARKTFNTVILPLVFPYILSSYAFCFVLSLNEYIIAFMVAGVTVQTVPIKIVNSLRYGYTPIMGSVAVIFVFLAAIIFGLIARYGNLLKLLGASGSEE